jgi:hypothetical protein
MSNNKITKGFISCEQAGNICDRSQYKESSFWERIKLELHIFWCIKCNEYVKRNSMLSKLLNTYSKETCEHHLSKEKKQALEKLIEEEIKN